MFRRMSRDPCEHVGQGPSTVLPVQPHRRVPFARNQLTSREVQHTLNGRCMIAAVAWRTGATLLAADADLDRVARNRRHRYRREIYPRLATDAGHGTRFVRLGLHAWSLPSLAFTSSATMAPQGGVALRSLELPCDTGSDAMDRAGRRGRFFHRRHTHLPTPSG